MVGHIVNVRTTFIQLKIRTMAHIDGAEVAKHTKKNDCWIVLDSHVYDVTSFLSEHPGGAPIILKNAGTVSTCGI